MWHVHKSEIIGITNIVLFRGKILSTSTVYEGVNWHSENCFDSLKERNILISIIFESYNTSKSKITL